MPTIARSPRPSVTLAFLATAGLSAACGAAPPGAPRSSAARVAGALGPARWIVTDGRTRGGPLFAGGQLALVGGRRVLIAKDETAHAETVPAPEALEELVVVPSANGPRLVGIGADGLYRFDDPLGAAVPLVRGPLCARFPTLYGLPGIVAVGCNSHGGYRRFFDLETGEERRPPGLPDLPLLDVAFRDVHEGAALVGLRRLVVTQDGGATWRPLPSKASRWSKLEVRDGALRLYEADFLYSPTCTTVDVVAGTLGSPAPYVPLQALPHPFLTHVEGTSGVLFLGDVVAEDPLAAAVAYGVPAPDGGAWLAKDDLLRMDLRSGDVAVVEALPREQFAYKIVPTADGFWIWGGGALVHATLDGTTWKLGAKEPLEGRGDWLTFRAAPAGGLMAGRTVRQPDGTWRDFPGIATACDLPTAGPLADGRVACLAPGAAGEPLQVVIVGPSGEVQRSPPLGRRPPATARPGPEQRDPIVELRTAMEELAIEEGRDHVLRFAMKDDGGVSAVALPLALDGAARVTRIPGAVRAAIRQGHGIAVGGGRVLASVDAGATWSEVPVSPRVRASIARVESGELAILVSEVGAVLGHAVRLGWGEGAEPEPPAVEPATRVAAVADRVFVSDCKDLHQVPPVAMPPGAAVLGVRTDPKVGPSVVDSLLGASPSLVIEGPPEGRNGPPTGITFRWNDPRDPAGPPHIFAWTGGPAFLRRSKDPWVIGLVGAALRDAAAFFMLETASSAVLVRADASGPGRVTSWPRYDGQPVDVVLGDGPGAPVAWRTDELVYVWRDREAPRAIATVRPPWSMSLHLGTPTADGVPLLLEDGGDVALTRVLAIPDAKAPAALPAIGEEGWQRVPFPLGCDDLPACDAGAPGTRFLRSFPHADPLTACEVRVSAGSACVAAVGGPRESVDLASGRGVWIGEPPRRPKPSEPDIVVEHTRNNETLNLSCTWRERRPKPALLGGAKP